MNGISALLKEAPESSVTQGHSERGISPHPKSSSTLILDSQASRTVRNKFVIL